MRPHEITALDHLLAVFQSRARVETLEQALHIVVDHHQDLAEHLRALLRDGGFGEHTLITPAGAGHLAGIHEHSAATCRTLAEAVSRALHHADSDREQP